MRKVTSTKVFFLFLVDCHQSFSDLVSVDDKIHCANYQSNFVIYTVKKVTEFPVPVWSVDGKIANLSLQCKYFLYHLKYHVQIRQILIEYGADRDCTI
jgi:hypothetical protein